MIPTQTQTIVIENATPPEREHRRRSSHIADTVTTLPQSRVRTRHLFLYNDKHFIIKIAIVLLKYTKLRKK